MDKDKALEMLEDVLRTAKDFYSEGKTRKAARQLMYAAQIADHFALPSKGAEDELVEWLGGETE